MDEVKPLKSEGIPKAAQLVDQAGSPDTLSLGSFDSDLTFLQDLGTHILFFYVNSSPFLKIRILGNMYSK